MLGKLFTVLISQSRFQGESLSVLTSNVAFSRFVIAPSDDTVLSGSALQCASLGAFGGFMERSFRAHDFLLGRRNCQKFLQDHFRLPMDNPIVKAGLSESQGYADAIRTQFSVMPPGSVTAPAGKVWMPLIPLMGSALAPVLNPVRGSITMAAMESIADAAISRCDAMKGPLLNGAPLESILKVIVDLICSWPLRGQVRQAIVDKLTKELAADVR